MTDSKMTKSVGCKVDPDVHQKLDDLAYERRTSISALLRGEIHDLLEQSDEVENPQSEDQPAE